VNNIYAESGFVKGGEEKKFFQVPGREKGAPVGGKKGQGALY